MRRVLSQRRDGDGGATVRFEQRTERVRNFRLQDPPRVVEIGPGRGALTEPLLERFERVLALELDENLILPLQQRFGGAGLQVRCTDALSEDLDVILAADCPWQVASNLPYSVGTAILRRLLPRYDLFSRLVVMLQREVAHRVVAKPGGKGHGLLALERAAWADAKLVFDVPPRALALASQGLTRARKMLANAFSPRLETAQIEAAGLDPTSRPGTITLAGWVSLATVLKKAP